MQLKVIRFADQLNKNVLYRQIFFLAVTVFSILVIGYHYGSFDQSVHIPFLKATADPSLYTNDPFVELRKNQFSFFWNLFIPFARSGLLEQAVFLAHFASVFLFYTAVWNLGMTLFQNPLAGLFAVISFIIPHTGFVGFPVIEFSLQSRTFVLPFLLYAFNLFLKRRHAAAFFLLGLAYNINLLMANFLFLSMMAISLIQIRQIGFRRFLPALFFFLVGAMPVLIWQFQSGESLNLSIQPDWLSAITQGVLHHVYYLFSLKPFLVLTLGGVCCILLFLIADSMDILQNHKTTLRLAMATLIGILIFQTISMFFFPATALIQMQLSRASHFILIFSYICFAGYLARLFLCDVTRRENLALLCGWFWLSVSPILPYLAFSIVKSKHNPFINRMPLVTFSLAVILIASMAAAIQLAMWQPGFITTERDRAWVDAQQWAKGNTDQDAVFITPPQEVGLYQPDWRVFSERATVVSLYDLFEVALKPDYFPQWKERFNLTAPGALQQFNGNFFENQVITREAYLHHDEVSIRQLAGRFEASYFVTESGQSYPFLMAYKNDYFQVYLLDPAKSDY